MRRAIMCTAAVVTATAVGAAATQAIGSAATARAAKAAKLRISADADGDPRFTKRRLRARAGRVTIVMRNPGSSGVPHAVGIEGRGVDKHGRVAAPGRVSRVSARLRKGRYEFYCPVGNHAEAGMKGTLIVR